MISVGIDVSKGKSTVCFFKPGGEILVTPFEIAHTKGKLNELADKINSYGEEARVVLENTGYYHWSVVKVLVERGIFVSAVNPLKMKRFCSQNIRKVKNDRIDAIHIASYGLTYWHELIPIQSSEDTYRELLLLSRQYHNVISLLIKAKLNFGNLLDQVMPGITSIIRDDRGSKLTEFVKKYVHFQHIDSMGEARFVRDFCKWSQKQGYRVDHERQAKKIFALVQNGIPVLPHTPTTKIVVLEALRRVNELENSRDIILTQMNELGKTLPEYSLISEMKCIGEGLTPRIIAEIGDVRRFHNKHSLIAYAGIDAPPYQSGSYNATERHITKRGNKYLRKVIFEVCLSYIQHKPEGDPVYEFIEKKRSEGKCGKEALVAGINKFLRIYYGKVTQLYRELEI